jgi:hypothetical protein
MHRGTIDHSRFRARVQQLFLAAAPIRRTLGRNIRRSIVGTLAKTNAIDAFLW